MRARTLLESGLHKSIAEVPLSPVLVLALCYCCWCKDHRSLTFHLQDIYFLTDACSRKLSISVLISSASFSMPKIKTTKSSTLETDLWHWEH